MDDIFAKLEAEYCPPLDPALFSAIVLDYDLTKEESVAEGRAILDQLKESALIDEADGFDPSGTGGQDAATTIENESEAGSGHATSKSKSDETDATTISNGLSSLDLDQNHVDLGDGGNSEALENLDEATKILILKDVTGGQVSDYSIRHTLRKCGGDCSRAIEELLTHVYLNGSEDSDGGEKISSKGVDGFSEDQIFRRGRKGKAKNRKKLLDAEERRASSMPAFSDDDTLPVTNKWQSAVEDVDFISIKTGISSVIIKPIYKEHGLSVPKTINALLKQNVEDTKHSKIDDSSINIHAEELGKDFPNIAPHYLTALIRITYPSTAAAHELARALVAKPKDSTVGGIQVIPKYTRPNISEVDHPLPPHLRKLKANYSPSLDGAPAGQRADAYAVARAQAFAQAGAAFRKAKSDRLMGGAAAYYSQRAHDLGSLYAGASASAFDDLASQQSTPTSVDLHGIDVANAVRIAKANVESWWTGLGEARVNGRVGIGERSRGYTIVVGLGRHSEGGKGKLGPAVGAMLRHEGWRFDGNGGEIIVRGRAKS